MQTQTTGMTEEHKAHLVLWVNCHDDGTAQPRASVHALGVMIKSTEYRIDGSIAVVEELAVSPDDARGILGY